VGGALKSRLVGPQDRGETSSEQIWIVGFYRGWIVGFYRGGFLGAQSGVDGGNIISVRDKFLGGLSVIRIDPL